ncbi:MAG: hypothetical protein ABUL64_03175 [Singulisphaera sp.]
MKFVKALAAVALVAVSLTGCGKESSVKKTTTVSTPEGKTTETTETTIDTHGKNPPPVPSQPNP